MFKFLRSLTIYICRFINALGLSVPVVLKIRNSGKWSDISDFIILVFISVPRKLFVFILSVIVVILLEILEGFEINGM